ncbi:uncharacterized protein LOC120269348 isoform X2 [Dioscorea cayenensis subsp. rotundata]|uniref:Uncharacterized protein LOC120269348 isoform X2 n=1 Tax=Dioscorea cayennensis subsp. rotundata TaxID=55577 RepID=A0AB40BYT6_DIOCR|nr:uncharacterized protein LOC120269348 isoform X2 [Dioscorea cayenensis subsp. rotundata]
MAERVENGVVWLPMEFFDDEFEEFRMGEKGKPEVAAVGVGMDLNSPTESLTETESDEEEFLAGLTRQMAHSFLDVGEDTVAFPGAEPKVLAGSPQSTLCAVEGWSGISKRKPDMATAFWVPPVTPTPAPSPFERSQIRSRDLLYAAAEQVMLMKLQEKEKQSRLPVRGLLATPKKPPPPAMPNVSKIRPTGCFDSPVSIPTLQQLEFERLKQEQLIKQQISAAWGKSNRGRSVGVSGGHGRVVGFPPSTWSSLQQQHQQTPAGPGMRAIFLNGSNNRRESTGTGVFLPRRAGNTNEARRKPACSTVLLPARVVQALNLNLDELNANSRFPGGYVVDQDVSLSRGGANAMPVKRNQLHHQPYHHRHPPATTPSAVHDVRLPSEWTY